MATALTRDGARCLEDALPGDLTRTDVASFASVPQNLLIRCHCLDRDGAFDHVPHVPVILLLCGMSCAS